MVRIEISTTRYQWAHGKKPSPLQHGWAFDFETRRGEVTEFAPAQLKLSEAKKWAAQRAVELGAYRIHVGS